MNRGMIGLIRSFEGVGRRATSGKWRKVIIESTFFDVRGSIQFVLNKGLSFGKVAIARRRRNDNGQDRASGEGA